jgi:4-hydroxybutyryl-CoA dehydratase / vinylacetyl-CoA-Delta-isomerase
MPMKTGAEYLESIRALNLEANILGEPHRDLPDHPLIQPSQRAVAAVYDCPHAEETRDLFTACSSLTGETICRFTHLHGSPEDLMNKVRMQRHCGGITGTCFQRCVGMDLSNAIFSTTFECDRKHGTRYHERFRRYWAGIQAGDLMVDGAMTDPKGDRGRRPGEQDDPDLYLRVVDRRSDGVVVRGAKLHQTGMLNSHEVCVMPTLTMRAGEEAYAVCFSLPTQTPGIRYIYGRQPSDTRKMETPRLDAGNLFSGQEVMTVFDDVFVPEERIFLDGEIEFSGMLVERFAGYHRQSYGGCKTGMGDVLIGAAALVARMNGTDQASHVKDKLVEMIHLNETLFACGIACSAMGKPTPAGNVLIDLLLANVCKLNVTRFPYEIARLATDVAGGIVGTLPSARDLEDPVTGPYIRKYLAAARGWETEDRIKVIRLIENLVVGAGSVAYLIESMHGAGPPMAQRIMIGRQGNLEAKMDRVKSMLGIFCR